MGLLNKLRYTGILLTGLAGCNYDTHHPIGKPGLERKVSVQAEKESGDKKTSLPQVSYEKAIGFFEPEMKKAKVLPKNMENLRGLLKEDPETRNLLYAIYSNSRKFEETYGKSSNKPSEDRFLDFKKDPLKHISEEELSEIHDFFPLIPGTKKELGYLRDTDKLTDKQYGDLIFLFINHEISGASAAGMMFQLNR